MKQHYNFNILIALFIIVLEFASTHTVFAMSDKTIKQRIENEAAEIVGVVGINLRIVFLV